MAADESTENTNTLSVSTWNEIQSNHKLSHKQRRGLLKKQKRKTARQSTAQHRDVEQPTLAIDVVTTSDDELQRQQDEEKRCVLHRVWMEREQMAQAEWTYQIEKAKREVEAREEQQKKIKEEWEERQKREQEEQEEKERKEKQRKEKQEALLKEATANERKNGPEAWHNPIAPANYVREKLRENCPFFIKTGVCRFGDRCSRVHPDPEVFHTLLFPGMYVHFQLEQALHDDDTDVTLEYEDSEIYQNFTEFYNDVLPEFKTVGQILQFKVCCNYEPHLRGNVYVQYRSVSDSQRALALFNARWYGGRQLSGQYVYIPQWKSAICGLFGRNRCPKGKNCNFLHVFCNPRGEFRHADSDHYPPTEASSHQYGNNNRSRYNSRDRTNSHRDSHSYSRSRRRSRSRSYSRSPSRMRSRRRSRSPSRQHSRRRSRSRSYSPDRKRYRRRSNSSSRYRKRFSRHSDSRSPESRQTRKRSRSNSPRQKRSRKRSGSYSSKNFKSQSKLSPSYSREDDNSKDYYSASSDSGLSNSAYNSDHEQPGDTNNSKTTKKTSKRKHKRKKHRKSKHASGN